MLKKYSSKRSRLDQSVLNELLKNAVSYDRIAGYFRSSLFEVAGESLEKVQGQIRMICNSDLDPNDITTAISAQRHLRQSWCEGNPEQAPSQALPRYQKLFDALTSKKIEIKVLPDSAFGLIHGKAGIIHYKDGSATSFLGSVNESASAWQLNYELLWEDDSEETVNWVQEEFDSLWNDHRAIDLSTCPFIAQDLKRILARKVITPKELKKVPDPIEAAAAAAVETPVYRKEQGLWPHQKYFARLALERHRLGGARLLLADQVGLGKTIQLAMAALLIALEEPEGGPILVLAPKPLLKQWQGELKELLKLPSARWEGKVWIDENEISYPSSSNKALAKCPRKIGLVSQGIIQRGIPETLEPLLKQQYSCIIVDESHRARRRNVPAVDADEREVNEIAEPNKLLEFLRKIAEQTKSMLLATATPVQLHPVEAWDLLHLLSHGNESVLGGWTRTSPWYQPSRCLAVATGDQELPNEANDGWEFVRDPLPAKSEDIAFEKIRKNLDASDDQWQFKPEALDKLSPAIRKIQLVNNILPEFGRRFNPMLRCIVRRTRSYLEETINPATGSYYLPKVSVRLFGETEEGAMILGGYLRDAYQEAEQFSMLLQQRIKSAGFFKTLLLRRLGSSIEAGRNTIKKLLGENENDLSEEEEDDFEDEQVPHNLFGQFQNNNVSEFKQFTDEELNSLQRCLDLLEQAGSQDPKLEAILGYLEGEHINTEQPWKDLGCILFSQYYDTVRWVGDAIAGMPEWQDMEIGLYAGSNRSGIWQKGKFSRIDRDILKSKVRQGELKILFGTDAASEGLNLQKLGTLINIDLPWNPTRLEQRKGRIQRIGQSRNEVFIANLRYRDSVEDRVHRVLADRLEAIHDLFGQIPDTLEDVWVHMALQDEEKARQRIERTSETRNPFDLKYSHVEDADWESSPLVIDPFEVNDLLTKGW